MDVVPPKVVTLAGLSRPVPSAESVEPPPDLGPVEDVRMREATLGQVMQRLQDATDAAGGDVLITVQDREVSLTQSRIAEEAAATRPLESGGLEVKFGTGFSGRDWFRWMWSVTDWVDRGDAHPIVRPGDVVPETVTGDLTVGMAADWGTNLYGAPKIARAMRAMAAERRFDLLMHLGDVYYSGTEEEVQERFLGPWPDEAGHRNRALNGNHDMYSGGFGYFDLTLKKFGQKGSYFAIQNEHWVLVGLDTAYVDHDIDLRQVAWLNQVLAAAGPRKVVLFSHQQPFSQLGNQGPKLQQALRHLLEGRSITAWYWGHEHQCVIYDQHLRWGLYGRCLGNGGVPEARKKMVLNAPESEQHPAVGEYTWRRLNATADAPGCVVLDGPNRDMTKPAHQERFGPHGFMTLAFTGAGLVERVHLSDGTVLMTGTVA